MNAFFTSSFCCKVLAEPSSTTRPVSQYVSAVRDRERSVGVLLREEHHRSGAIDFGHRRPSIARTNRGASPSDGSSSSSSLGRPSARARSRPSAAGRR